MVLPYKAVMGSHGKGCSDPGEVNGTVGAARLEEIKSRSAVMDDFVRPDQDFHILVTEGINELGNFGGNPIHSTFLIHLPCPKRIGAVVENHKDWVVFGLNELVPHGAAVHRHTWYSCLLHGIFLVHRSVLVMLTFAFHAELTPCSKRNVV